MDYASHSILRSSSELSNHIHSLGYCRPAGSSASWRFDLSSFWKEMVSFGNLIRHRHSRNSDDYLRFFRSLRRGKHRLLLWPDREADGSNDTTTPSKIGVRDEMGRLEKVSTHHVVIFFYTLNDIDSPAGEEVRERRLAQI